MNPRKLLRKAINSPKNFPFHDFLTLARAFGFEVALWKPSPGRFAATLSRGERVGFSPSPPGRGWPKAG